MNENSVPIDPYPRERTAFQQNMEAQRKHESDALSARRTRNFVAGIAITASAIAGGAAIAKDGLSNGEPLISGGFIGAATSGAVSSHIEMRKHRRKAEEHQLLADQNFSNIQELTHEDEREL